MEEIQFHNGYTGYRITGDTLYQYKCTWLGSTNADYTVWTYKAGLVANTNLGNVVALGTALPENGLYTDNYWYIRTTQIPYYNLFKYNNQNVLVSNYDVINKTLYSPIISMTNSSRYVKIKLSVPVSTNYSLYISTNNLTWAIVTPSNLDGNSYIDLGSTTNTIYWKIILETDTSKIDSIKIIN